MRQQPHTLTNRRVKITEGRESLMAAMLDSLLRLYVIGRCEALPSLTLSQSKPMGEFSTDDDNRDHAKAGLYHQMTNRLKVLANLNPVLYQQPVTATLIVTIENEATGELRDERLRLYFDDRAADPFCRIEIDHASS